MAYPQVFNVAKGRVAELAALAGASDSIVRVPLESTGLVVEATMIDYDSLDAILAGASNEQTTMGRKTVTGVVVTIDDTNNRVDVDAADDTWTAATGNDTGLLVTCYKPDSGAADSAIVPLVADTFVSDPTGGDVTYQTNAAGFYRAS